LGCGDGVQQRASRLEELTKRAEASGETVFAQQIRVLDLELTAALAHCGKDDAKAVALMQHAVELETATPKPAVTPAPTLPASALLGDLFLTLGRPGEALAAYEKSLQTFPHRFNSTIGLARARKAIGDTAGATRAYCELLRVAKPGSRAETLDDVR